MFCSRLIPTLLLPCISALFFALGCPGETPDSMNNGEDGGISECHPELPPPSHPCLEGQCGNEIGVGQPCTQGSGECSDYATGQAVFCTVDFSETDLWFCTRPCVFDADCGSGAVCDGDPDDPQAGKGCVPSHCIDWEDPLWDGGQGQEGQSDAGNGRN
jgi:hypothetical protein